MFNGDGVGSDGRKTNEFYDKMGLKNMGAQHGNAHDDHPLDSREPYLQANQERLSNEEPIKRKMNATIIKIDLVYRPPTSNRVNNCWLFHNYVCSSNDKCLPKLGFEQLEHG